MLHEPRSRLDSVSLQLEKLSESPQEAFLRRCGLLERQQRVPTRMNRRRYADTPIRRHVPLQVLGTLVQMPPPFAL
jgi:hypothetical protein